jgi:DNA-binding LacI/PurR family transcriptional regulator
MVINGRDDLPVPISESTRQKVMEAARQLGYSPNPAAQMLAHGTNMLLGVFTYEAIFPHDEDNFYYAYLNGIQRRAARQNYNLLLFTQNHNSAEPQIYHNAMNTLRLASGSIIMGRKPDLDEIKLLLRERYPFVFMGRREVPGYEIDWVTHDYRVGSRQAAQYLLDTGHRRIAYVATDVFPHEPLQDKLTGCERAIERVPDAHISIVPKDAFGDTQAFGEFIRDHEITALVCGDIGSVTQTMTHLTALNLRVPDDISLVSLLNDRANFRYFDSPSYVQLNQAAVGEQAVDILIARLTEPDLPPQQIAIECAFVAGDTVARLDDS